MGTSGRPAGRSDELWRAAPRMVGRESELRTLLAALRLGPSLALVVGEAGIGKSRLIHEARDCTDLRWFVGRCRPSHDPAPLAPVLEALPDIPDLAAEEHAVFGAIVDTLATAGPAALLVEDLHWADGETLRLLRFLAYRLPPQLRLVGSYRPEDTPHAGEITALAGCVPAGTRTAEVRLHPLAAPEVRELATQVLGVEALPVGLVQDLCERTGGLPFVVEELLRGVPTEDAAELDGTAVVRAMVETETPVALRASVTIRLEQVPEACRRVVWAAAVLDAPVTDALLAVVADLTETHIAGALDVALARGLLGQPRPGVYDLRHALARRAVYETIPPDQLRRLHRRAATALAALEPTAHARIAYQCRLGGLLQDWLVHAEIAADQAGLGGDHATATALLTEVLRADALPVPDRARLAAKLGEVAQAGIGWVEPVATIRAVLTGRALTGVDRGRLELALGLLLQGHAGEVLAGRAELAGAVVDLAGAPELARALVALAVPVLGREPIADHRAWLLRALQIDVPAPVRICVDLGRAAFLVWTGDPGGLAAAQQALDQPVTAATCRQLAAGAGTVAGALAWLGRDAESATALDRATDLAVPANAAFTLIGVAATRLRLAFAAGEWVGLPERIGQARPGADRLPLLGAEIDLVLARLRLARGDLTGARQLLRTVVRTAEQGGPMPLWAAAIGTVGRLHRAVDRPELALRETESCVAVVRRKDGWVWAGEVVAEACLALHRTGRRDAAYALADELGQGLAGRDAPASAAAGRLARAGLAELDGELTGAAREFAAAADGYRAIGRRYDELLALEGRGRCLLRSGQPEGLATVARGYQVLGARWDFRRCRDVLRLAGVPVPDQRGRRGYGNTLSPREREVARLAAAGMRNVSIAATLSLSVRTVEDHLSKAMRKLNVRSRRDLGPLVRDRD